MKTDKFPIYSNMEFISVDAYLIEDSPVYEKLRDNGIRSVEFVRIKDNKMLFIEAKTTLANPDSSPNPYKKEIEEIYEKFIHSLSLLSAIEVGVIKEILPSAFNAHNKLSLIFILVIRNHRGEWCRPIKREIEQRLPIELKKIWQPTVLVINYEMAKKLQLVN